MAYTNSPLVVHKNLSPNNSGARTHAIDRISPHCVVGQCTAESLGEWFAKTSTQASSNYGIDKSGRVGMYVEEKNRSWCTSSNANDQRAVTIECASGTSEPYAMNDAVYATLINLCVDICKRNGKKKLIWFGDKDKTLNYTPASDEMIITVHRWFANKSCPGTWLYNRLGDLAAKVTEQLKGETAEAPKEETSSVIYRVQCGAFSVKANAEALVEKLKAAGFEAFVVGSEPEVKKEESTPVTDVAKYIWDYLIKKGLNAFATAGLMGNLFAESCLNPKNLQNAYEKSLGMNDESYTAAVDNGTYGNFVHDSAGYGLVQWTFWSRKEGLLNFAKAAKKSIGDLDMQLDFMWKELQGYSSVIGTLKTATSVKQASDSVLTGFERPADMSDSVKEKRASYGQSYYDKYVGTQTPSVSPQKPSETAFEPYVVKITADVLNIRREPTTASEVVSTITDFGCYTIVEESTGTGATKWGKLKSGLGWISLDYANRI